MEEKKFGQGFLIGSLVGLGVGVTGTCVAAALMSDDESEPEIDEQEDVQTKDSETENATSGFLGSFVKAAEKAGDSEFKESSIEGTTIQQANSDE